VLLSDLPKAIRLQSPLAYLAPPKIEYLISWHSLEVVKCIQRFAARPKRRNAEHNDQEGGH